MAGLGRTWEFPGKDLDRYVRKFHEKVLDCCDLVYEEVLVNVCLLVWDEYRAFLKDLSFSSIG